MTNCERYATRQERPHYVYRLYDRQSRLLYIGCAEDVEDRLYHHLSLCNLGNGVAEGLHFRLSHYTTWRYPTRWEARRAEADAIGAEAPLLNKIHNKGRYTPLSLRPDDFDPWTQHRAPIFDYWEHPFISSLEYEERWERYLNTG